MRRRHFAATLLAGMLSALDPTPSTPRDATGPGWIPVRAMWVWNTSELIASTSARTSFLEHAKGLGLTDAYLFIRAAEYSSQDDGLTTLLGAMRKIGVRAWGMEGWRGYFSDGVGPAELYAAVDALVGYNDRHDLKFAGFHSDIEPHDGQDAGENRFINGIAESQLTQTQLSSRDEILTEWLGIHEALLAKTTAAGIEYGAAIASWVDDYYGEPLHATFRGVRKPLLEHLFAVVPQYVVMSYSTSPSKVVNVVQGELRSASGARRVMFGLETHAGPGANISYADTPGKNKRSQVLSDLKTIEGHLAAYPSYLGWSIHDWEGWLQLPD